MSNMFNCCSELLSVNIKGNFLIDQKNIEIKNLSCESISTISEEEFKSILNIDENLSEELKTLSIALSNIKKNEFSYLDNLEDLDSDINSESSLSNITVTNLSKMFYECKSLISLPDISKWNISFVTDVSFMFWGCESLKSLPDISKWNTFNIIYMDRMFYRCKSLISLPDISKWNTNKVINMN